MPSRSRISTPRRALAVPDRDGEHAAQVLGQRGPVVLVEVRQDLGVAAAAQHVAARLELLAQRRVVVDLAVLRRPDAAALVGEGLVAALDVDDREPPGAERAAVAGRRSRRRPGRGRPITSVIARRTCSGSAGAPAPSSRNAPAMPHMAATVDAAPGRASLADRPGRSRRSQA